MSIVTSHLARRGIELASEMAEHDRPSLEDMKISPVGIVLIVLTLVIMAAVLTLTNYTFGILRTLTALEDTSKGIALVTDPADPTKLSDPELLIVQQKPITSKMRSTIRHLHREAGWTARWRGLWLAICIYLVHAVLMGLMSGMLGGLSRNHHYGLFAWIWPILVNYAANIVASIVLARWSITWTHIVLTIPDQKPWFRRVPSWKAWRKVLLPTAFVAFFRQLSLSILAWIVMAVSALAEHGKLGVFGLQVFGVVVLYFVLLVALVFPAEVSLTRIQASLLPEDAEPIIPFDASFGGMVIPESLGGKGYLSFVESWRTVDKETCRRYFKMVIKTTLVYFVLTLCFSFILGAEVSVFAWDAIKDQIGNNNPPESL